MIRGISEEAIRAVQAYHRAAMERQKYRLDSPTDNPPGQDLETGSAQCPELNTGTEWRDAGFGLPHTAASPP